MHQQEYRKDLTHDDDVLLRRSWIPQQDHCAQQLQLWWLISCCQKPAINSWCEFFCFHTIFLLCFCMSLENVVLVEFGHHQQQSCISSCSSCWTLDSWNCWLLASYPPVPWQAAAEIGCLGAEDLDIGYIVTSLLQVLNLKYCQPDLVAYGFRNRIAEKDHLDAAALEDW